MDPYKVLGLPKGASSEDVKQKYKKLAREYHPDKNPGKETEAFQKFHEIKEAYDAIMHREKNFVEDLEVTKLTAEISELEEFFKKKKDEEERRHQNTMKDLQDEVDAAKKEAKMAKKEPEPKDPHYNQETPPHWWGPGWGPVPGQQWGPVPGQWGPMPGQQWGPVPGQQWNPAPRQQRGPISGQWGRSNPNQRSDYRPWDSASEQQWGQPEWAQTSEYRIVSPLIYKVVPPQNPGIFCFKMEWKDTKKFIKLSKGELSIRKLKLIAKDTFSLQLPIVAFLLKDCWIESDFDLQNIPDLTEKHVLKVVVSDN